MNEQRPTTQSVSLDDEAIIDVKAAGNFFGYLSRSLKRQRKTLWSTAIVLFVIIAVITVVMPKSFKIETRILTHSTVGMEAAVGGSAPGPGTDHPTAGATELIKSRENMENLITDIKLQEVWEAKRGPASRLKDKIFAAIGGAPNEADVHEAYLKMLDDKITAGVDNEVVTMAVEWPDPDVAMSLSEGLVARFLKMRHDMELSEVIEGVNILERNVDASRQNVEQGIGKIQKIFDEKESELAQRASGSKSAPAPHKRKTRSVAFRKPISSAQAETSADNEAHRSLSERQSALTAMKRKWEMQLKKAQEDLANLRSTLGPDHPDYQDKKREVDALANMPPEIRALDQDVQDIQKGIAGAPSPVIPKTEFKPLAADPTPTPVDDSFDMQRIGISDDVYAQIESDPEITSVIKELDKLQDTHDVLVQKLKSARIESEIKNAAFEYRYIMTEPPVYPKKPVKPNVPLMLGGGAFVAFFIGALSALAKDVLARKILESWQIERFLNVKVFGEIDDQ